MATYPKAVARFTTKRNLLNFADANDLNAVQDELAAVQAAVGSAPGVEPSLNGQMYVYSTVRSRMEAISRGLTTPVVRLDLVNLSIPINGTTRVNYTKPTVTNDPMNAFNGAGFTAGRAGWWIITSSVRWPANSNGYRTLVLKNSETLMLSDDYTPPATQLNAVMQTVTWQGPLAVGAAITTDLFQNSNAALLTDLLSLSASFVRDM